MSYFRPLRPSSLCCKHHFIGTDLPPLDAVSEAATLSPRDDWPKRRAQSGPFSHATVAPSDTTVLLLGGNRCGQGLLARPFTSKAAALYDPSSPWCAALSATLIESELFGHESCLYRAVARQWGASKLLMVVRCFWMRMGDLPLELQAKLLRVLQQGEFERVGSSRTLRVDVRVIAATNRDLEADMRGGRFRSDLYYRLAVFPITVPALKSVERTSRCWYVILS